jgi:hypothetical protein
LRRAFDAYETAPFQVNALTTFLPELWGSVWCPCVGDGSLMRQLQLNRADLGPFITNDLDPSKTADVHGDATRADTWDLMREAAGGKRPDWVIENPPFDVEDVILQHAWRVAKVGVVFMARVSFAEPTRKRGPWLAEHPYDKRITLERHSFTANGRSDNVTTDWLVWARVPLSGPFGITAYGFRPTRVRSVTSPAPSVLEKVGGLDDAI